MDETYGIEFKRDYSNKGWFLAKRTFEGKKETLAIICAGEQDLLWRVFLRKEDGTYTKDPVFTAESPKGIRDGLYRFVISKK